MGKSCEYEKVKKEIAQFLHGVASFEIVCRYSDEETEELKIFPGAARGGSRHRAAGSEYRNQRLYFIGMGGSATPE